MAYVERLSAPSKNDSFYYSNSNLYYKNGYGMPNCTAYACGRFAELHGKFISELAYGNAEDWYPGTTKLEKGQTPRLGAIICWRKGATYNGSDGAGHVAIVERINSDGSILTSNSAYKGTNFYTQTIAKGYALSGYTFQGFIYPDANISDTVPTGPIGTPVTRNTSVDQVEILVGDLRARIRPETNDAVILGFVNKGVYNVLSTRDMTQEGSNGYFWYQIEANVWVARGDAWSAFYSADTASDKDKEIAQLKKELADANTELEKVKKDRDTLSTNCAILKTALSDIKKIADDVL